MTVLVGREPELAAVEELLDNSERSIAALEIVGEPALDRSASACAGDASLAGEPVRYLGSILMRVDEVVLCSFEGTADAVRRVAERATIPFDRIVETFQSSSSDLR